MSKIVTIKNDFLTVEINSFGAELHSIKDKKGVDFLYDGDPSIWAGRAPLLFPICGSLKNETYTHEGKEYTLPQHGFAKAEEFEVVEEDTTQAAFRLSSNERLKKVYPFDFNYYVTFSLFKNTITVEYRMENPADEKLYFSCGSHEAFATPEGVEEYSLVFDKKVTLENTVLEGPLVTNEKFTLLENSNELKLQNDFFKYDTLVFENVDFTAATLVHRKTGRKLRLDFEGFDNMLVWTIPDFRFLCIEPWCSPPDRITADGILEHKEAIITCEPHKQVTRRHIITVD